MSELMKEYDAYREDAILRNPEPLSIIGFEDWKTGLIVSLRSQLSDYEEKEAACCPEDVGFDEYIKYLKDQLSAKEKEIEGMREAIREIIHKADDALYNQNDDNLFAKYEKTRENIKQFILISNKQIIKHCKMCNGDGWLGDAGFSGEESFKCPKCNGTGKSPAAPEKAERINEKHFPIKER